MPPYVLPATRYFVPMSNSMTLSQLAGYAAGEARATIVGDNLGVALTTPMDPALEYSPYGGGLVERMREKPETSHYLTAKWRRALVASPGTAILGLGAADSVDDVLRARSAAPIMAGKAKWFLTTAGVRTDYQTIETPLRPDQKAQLREINGRSRKDLIRRFHAENFAYVVGTLLNNYGFVNIEDAQGADLPLILSYLEANYSGECTWWSDDKQGTGTITAAGVLAWTKLTKRKIEDIKVVIFGAGAGAMGVYDELLNHGVKAENILVTDRGPAKDDSGKPYALDEGRDDVIGDPFKEKMRQGIPAGTTVDSFAVGADLVINLGVVETFEKNPAWTQALVSKLAKNFLFAVMTNPEPGITPQRLAEVRPDGFYASGNQIFENAFNNFAAFGFVGGGVLMSEATQVTPAMTVAAARGICEWAMQHPEFGRHRLVPRPDEIELIRYEAGAVALAAAKSGVSRIVGPRPTRDAIKQFEASLNEMVAQRMAYVQELRERLAEDGKRFYQSKFGDRYAPFQLLGTKRPIYDVAPEIKNQEEFVELAKELGVSEGRWDWLFDAEGRLLPQAMTMALQKLIPANSEHPFYQVDQAELKVISDIAVIFPELGLALAVRRSRLREENRQPGKISIFERDYIERVVLRYIPQAREAIDRLKQMCDRLESAPPLVVK